MKFRFAVYPSRREFVEGAIAGKKLRLLDVGNLGDGESNCRLLCASVEGAGGEYVGLDSNAALTERMGLKNQVVGDLHDAPFEDASFDAVYAGEIIEHTWRPGRMIGECRRILKPGGLLILDTPNAFNLVHVLRFYLKDEDSMGDVRVQTYHEAKNAMQELKDRGDVLLQPQHKIFFTPAMLTQLLETHGFRVLSVGCTHKPRSLIHKVLLKLFPQGGRHLCVVARKETVDDVFADVRDSAARFV